MFSGSRLKEARTAMRENGRTVSQERFAELLGVARRSPGRWENGEVEPRMAQLVRISEVTGMPVGFFFDGPDGKRQEAPELVAELLDRLADALHGLAEESRGPRNAITEVAA